jgi:hypothetical protein
LFQLKYLEKDEFKDIRHLSRIKLDGNQLSVVIDNLFEMQKNLEYLGTSENTQIFYRKRKQFQISISLRSEPN